MLPHSFSIFVNGTDEWLSERQQWAKPFTSIRSTSQVFLWLMVWGQMLGFKGSPGLWYRASCSPPWGQHCHFVSLHNFPRLSCHTSSKGSLPHAVEYYVVLSAHSLVLVQKKNSFGCTWVWSTDPDGEWRRNNSKIPPAYPISPSHEFMNVNWHWKGDSSKIPPSTNPHPHTLREVKEL